MRVALSLKGVVLRRTLLFLFAEITVRNETRMYDDADGDEAKPETCSLRKKRCQRRIMPSTRVEAIGGVKVCDLKPQCMCTHTHILS